jgi:lysophospholipase L1-like esterase
VPAWPRPGRRAALAWIVVGVAVATVAGFAVVRCRSSAESSGDDLDIAVVGDSFMEQSATQFVGLAGEQGRSAEVDAFGGLAACDRKEALEGFARSEPDVLIMSFAGNDITPCMLRTQAPSSAAETAEEYREDLDRLVDDFLATSPETRVYVVPPPPVQVPEYEANAAAMRAMYQRFAAEHPGVTVVDVTPALSPDGAFHERLPCEPWEERACEPDGTVKLREDDGVHLTPAGGERYARVLADAVGAS